MQEEVNHKTVALVVNGTRMTASVLYRAISKKVQEDSYKRKNQKNVVRAKKQSKQYKGKMSVKRLVSSGTGVSNIEITEKNIKSFEQIARKYGLDFALKKDNSKSKPRYIVFFRGKDTDVINQAFKEYMQKNLKRAKKPSIKKRLQHYKGLAAKTIQKSRNKTKGLER